MAQEVKTAQDFLAILKRRRWTVVLLTAVIFVISVVVAFVIPPTYRSTSTVLIEEQEVPREMVATTVTSYADQRLQTINQRIMGTTKLLEIINRFHLYENLKDTWTTEEIVDKLRKDIKMKPISADVIDPRSGMPRPATIAFTISYDGKSPQVVQRVASELASLYLAENLATRERESSGTSTFMEEEMKQTQAALAASEAKLAAYRKQHVTALPELAQVNNQILDQVERDLVVQNEQLKALKEKESQYKSQLASISTDAASQDKARLNELRVHLNELKTRYTDQHPDVIKTKSELAELMKQLRASGRDTADNKPDNVAYVTLSSQLSGVQSEIGSVKRQIASLTKRRDDYRGRIATSPGVEEGFRNIATERNSLQLKFDELSKKYMDAKTAHGLEKEQKGERFSLIDAARLPEKPVMPNIPLILCLGLVLGLGCGVGIAIYREQTDSTFRTPERLALATALPVLSCIPEIVSWQDLAQRKAQRKKIVLACVMVTVLAPVACQFLVMDLDVVWAKVLRRMAKM
jgi:polysaccharide chain length determinant protein (PEP-CTERM system associated)